MQRIPVEAQGAARKVKGDAAKRRQQRVEISRSQGFVATIDPSLE
jgi:hypothetical protein